MCQGVHLTDLCSHAMLDLLAEGYLSITISFPSFFTEYMIIFMYGSRKNIIIYYFYSYEIIVVNLNITK